MNTALVRKRLVIGNWKMHGTRASNAALLTGLCAGVAVVHDCDLAVCAPFPYLAQVSSSLAGSGISWGAQDISKHEHGAYTGEVSSTMLGDFGCKWTLVGHSERRTLHGESDQLVADKAVSAIKAGITPVVCIGETFAEQEAGRTNEVISRQLAPVLALGAQSLSQMVLAYEPVWAIGTGLTATPQQAQDVHAFIRAQLSELGVPQVRILYGGSVKASNAVSLFAMSDIDGALVGGASLVAEEFLRIAAA
ncbi:triose-phosphate isomerase [Candidimonas sp. SYP-B2681]|uniref:triose-phosphate isomerase n=1 Tax=Candidimonas sp. SYP-B2681 TaxID=2497686 RepID=UPI000F895588|nr:triose-phosphate isomerase [Candidimonas sp. SYP-B2681]RTZ42406.1 triose-phosphate isomerase [Candidimonas sp. SYP-B2681]